MIFALLVKVVPDAEGRTSRLTKIDRRVPGVSAGIRNALKTLFQVIVDGDIISGARDALTNSVPRGKRSSNWIVYVALSGPLLVMVILYCIISPTLALVTLTVLVMLR